MYNICTTIEQSKKLIELGIDRTTADMYYSFDYNIEEYDEDAQIIPKSELGQHFSLFPDDIPAWSLTALLGLIPRIEFSIYYHSEDSPYIVKDNLINAAFEMVCWLLENKKL